MSMKVLTKKEEQGSVCVASGVCLEKHVACLWLACGRACTSDVGQRLTELR